VTAPAALLGTIANAKPGLHTVVEHVLYLPELCPASRNPAPGSTLTLRYVAGERLLELFSLDRYIDAFLAHPVVRDIELFVQTAAQDAANAAGVEVTATAEVRLNGLRQGQRVTVMAVPEAH
jgi:7-cyano-7-deazaguanine reductase